MHTGTLIIPQLDVDCRVRHSKRHGDTKPCPDRMVQNFSLPWIDSF